MTEDDWIEKGCGNLSASIQILDESTGYYGYSTSNMHLIADDDSNVYVLVILDGNIVVYKYDSTTKNFEKTQAEYSAAEMVDYRFSVYYDSQSGKSGTIYIGFTDFVVVYFAGYDIATDSFFTYEYNAIGNILIKDPLLICSFSIFPHSKTGVPFL